MQDSEMKYSAKSIAIGAAAGFVAALLSASASSPSLLSIVIMLVTPMPVLLAGLGWGPAAGIAAVAAAGITISVSGQPLLALIHALAITIPAAAMAHFASLGKPGPDGGMEWFPLSSILMRAIALLSAGFMAAGLITGYGPALANEVANAIAAQVQASDPSAVISAEQRTALASMFANVIPYAMPAYWLMVLTGNFYAAVHIARKSGLLHRARDFWPSALRLPKYALVALAVTLALSFLSGGLGDLAAVPAGALAAAFCAVGLALLHGATVGKPWRGPALGATYAAILLVTIPLIPLFFAGLFVTAKQEPESTH
jgi:Predicted membrane protein (DUF2232)